MVWPPIAADPYCVRAPLVRAVDKEAAHARGTHLSKGDLPGQGEQTAYAEKGWRFFSSNEKLSMGRFAEGLAK